MAPPSHPRRSAVGTWWREGHPLVPNRWTHSEDWSELTWIGRAVNVYHRRTMWLKPSFWACIWKAPPRYHRNGKTTYEWRDLDRWRVRYCRFRGHPSGIVHYNAGGFEPDTRCQDCDEDIG